MTMLLVDGFDHADHLDVWTQISPGGLSTTNPRTGTRSYQPGIETFYRALQVGVEDDDGVTMGSAFYQEITNAGPDGTIFHTLREDTVIHITAGFYAPTRSLRIYRGQFPGGFGSAGTLLAESVINIWTYDTWHYLETGVKIADAGGTVEVRLNGATVLSFAGDTNNGGVAGKINRMGIETANTGQVRRVDDCYLLNEQGAAPWNSFLGDTRCFPSYPMGNGFYAMWMGSDGNQVNNYLLVDEAGVPVTTDYIESLTPGDIDSFEIEDLPVSVGTIRAVETRLYAAKSETGTKQIRPMFRRSGADAFGADHVLAEDSFVTYRDIFQLDPLTGLAWTITNFNNTEAGAQVRA